MLPAESTDHLGGPYACSPGGEIFLLIPLHLSEVLGNEIKRLRSHTQIEHKWNEWKIQNTQMRLDAYFQILDVGSP